MFETGEMDMTYLLWVRTHLRISSYAASDIEEFEGELRHRLGSTLDEPFCAGDQFLYPLAETTVANIYSVKALIAPALAHRIVDNWSLTEVGRGFGREVEMEEVDGGSWWDDRFVDSEDGEFFTDDMTVEALAKWGAERSLSALNWSSRSDCDGATALWIDLDRDYHQNDPIIRSIERVLPKPRRIWHGRTSVALVYTAPHDIGAPRAFGFSEALSALLADEQVADWLIFQVGSLSVGGIAEPLNEMADFIWKRRSSHRQKVRHLKPHRPPSVTVLRSRGRGK